jgi:hypothetical protein
MSSGATTTSRAWSGEFSTGGSWVNALVPSLLSVCYADTGPEAVVLRSLWVYHDGCGPVSHTVKRSFDEVVQVAGPVIERCWWA